MEQERSIISEPSMAGQEESKATVAENKEQISEEPLEVKYAQSSGSEIGNKDEEDINPIPEIEAETEEDMEKLRQEEEGISEAEKKERRSKALEMKKSANEYYQAGNYQQACNLYTRAVKVCPVAYKSDVAILYANRAVAKVKLDPRYNKSAIEDCSKAIDLNPSYLKPRLRRAAAYMSEEKLDEASTDLKFALSCEPLNREAVSMYKDLEEKLAERQKKYDEMIGQLKQLGNMVLRPFGLSTDNFRLNRDPTTNSYSVEMVQNPQQVPR